MSHVIRSALAIFSLMMLSPVNASEHAKDDVTTISAARLNEDAAAYDGQTVFVTGYLHTAGHRWEFAVTDHRKYRDAECLNIGISDSLSAHRAQFDKRRVTLKGVFYKGDWANSWCFCDNGNGVVTDEQYLKTRYSRIIATGSH